ncbi:PA14 domain-containing protein [Hymenobacter weizhouensis]|uniref:PA14 domain-containing protein n=1 Tax=Hymenobacter sp. YIM 151500-1 TaxID=2987689 RepID=UPI00222705C2|nr:PA14 domain-containing protein [Hymenobacter sp. YIM 151500-1]UYZ62960.1 PA14 domain-containing protein [Hymenobacter sp. YIM 151500-1]
MKTTLTGFSRRRHLAGRPAAPLRTPPPRSWWGWLGLLLALVLPTVASAQYVSVSGTEFRANGSRIWFNGANTPWHNWNDFGGDFNQAWWSTHFQTLKDNGINSTRVWITCNGEVGVNIGADGTVTGATQAHWNHLDQLFQIARDKQIYVLATLISFDHGQDYHPNHLSWRNMLNSAAATKSYVDNYVTPFVNRYKSNPYVFAVDICNEIEWYNEQADCGNIAWANLQRFVAQCAAAIHRNSTMLVTVGTGPFVKYTSSMAGHKFTDAALQAQNNDFNAYLDFYSPHYFDWMYDDLSQANPYTKSPADFGMTDKPCLVGETPAKGTTKPTQTLTQNYENAFQRQWQGVMAWTSNGVDTNGDITQLGVATKAFRDNHNALVYPPALRPADNPAGAVAGLAYQYYEGTWSRLPNFATLTATKVGTTTNVSATTNRNRADNYAFRYTGYVQVPTDGQYTFYTTSDDGSRLLIGDQVVVQNDGPHGPQERSGTIGLKAGRHPITVLYFEGTGGETLSLSYAGPGISKTSVPASSLSRTEGNTALSIYADALAADWADWSWSTTTNLANATPVRVGSRSASATYTSGFGGFALRKGTAISTSGYTALKFWVHGGTGSNKNIKLYTQNADNGGESTITYFTATAGAWNEITISLSALGNPGSIKRLTFQENGGAAQPAIYFDDIRLVSGTTAARGIAGTEPAEAPAFAVAAFPNPFSDRLSVHVSAAAPEAVEVRIFNQLGQEVFRQSALPLNRLVTLRPALPDGLYLVRILSEQHSQEFKLVRHR